MKLHFVFLLSSLICLQVHLSFASVNKRSQVAHKIQPEKTFLTVASPRAGWLDSYEYFKKIKDSKIREAEAARIATLFYEEEITEDQKSNLNESRKMTEVLTYLLERVELKTKAAISDPLLKSESTEGEFARDSARRSLEDIKNEYAFLDSIFDFLKSSSKAALSAIRVDTAIHRALKEIEKAQSRANLNQDKFQPSEHGLGG